MRILKSAEPEEILQSIAEVYAGGAPMSSQIARRVVDSFRKPVPEAGSTLSSREKDTVPTRGLTQ